MECDVVDEEFFLKIVGLDTFIVNYLSIRAEIQ